MRQHKWIKTDAYNGHYQGSRLADAGQRLLELLLAAGSRAKLADELRVLDNAVVQKLGKGEHQVRVVRLVRNLRGVVSRRRSMGKLQISGHLKGQGSTSPASTISKNTTDPLSAS